MGSKTAAILSLLCTLAVCSQPSDQKLLSPKTPILPQGGRSAALYGTDQVIVPRLNTGDDVPHSLMSAINEGTGRILEGEDDNINDPSKLNTDDAGITVNLTPNVNGDTTATVVDLSMNDPSQNSHDRGVVLTLPQSINGDTTGTVSQHIGSMPDEEDHDFDLLNVELTKLHGFAVPSSVTPNVWPTVAVTPPGQGFGYISNGVDLMVSNTWPGAIDLDVIHEAIGTAYATPQTYPWQQQYGELSSPLGVPLGYPQVHGAQIVAIPPVPPNAYGSVQKHPQQQLHGPSSPPFVMALDYPQADGVAMLLIPPVPPNAYGPVHNSAQQQSGFLISSDVGGHRREV